MEFITAKGIIFENYNAPAKKKSIKEEEILLHGIERNIDLDSLHPVKKTYYKTKAMFKEYYYQNSRDIYLGIIITVIFLFIFVILNKLNKIQNILLEMQTNNNYNNNISKYNPVF